MCAMEFNFRKEHTVRTNACVCVAGYGRKEELEQHYECHSCGCESFKFGRFENKPYLKCRECGELHLINVECFI
jgi:DNA-directed RNA polymerase subunit RPC12/RpoP